MGVAHGVHHFDELGWGLGLKLVVVEVELFEGQSVVLEVLDLALEVHDDGLFGTEVLLDVGLGETACDLGLQLERIRLLSLYLGLLPIL